MNRLVSLILATALMDVLGRSAALARPPEHADPALAPWFQGLQSPIGGGCCSQADGRVTEYRVAADGGYEALVDGRWDWYVGPPVWVPVPKDVILERTDNPTGGAVLFLFDNGQNPWGTVLC